MEKLIRYRLWYAEAGGHVFFDFTGPITRGDDVIEWFADRVGRKVK